MLCLYRTYVHNVKDTIMEPLYQDTPEMNPVYNWDTVPISHLFTQPLSQRHLTIQDTLMWPYGVHIR